jgi:hypothetical protein
VSCRWPQSASINLVEKPFLPCFLMKHDARRSPHGYRGVVPSLPQGGCTAEGCPKCSIDILHYCESGTHWPCERGVDFQFRHPVLSLVEGTQQLVFFQSALGLGDPIIAATSPSGPGIGVVGPAEAPRLASDIDAGLFSPVGFLVWVPSCPHSGRPRESVLGYPP